MSSWSNRWAISYALNLWSRIEFYLSDGQVEIDENVLRPVKLDVK